MSQSLLATPEVMKARVQFYYDDYAWETMPDTFMDDMTLDEFAVYLSENFGPMFYVEDDFLMPGEVKDSIYLETYVGEIDAYIDQTIGDTK